MVRQEIMNLFEGRKTGEREKKESGKEI